MKLPTLKSVKLLCHRVLRGAPITPRTRYRPPSSSPELFFILVFSPVHRIRLGALFTGFVFGTVLRPVHRPNCIVTLSPLRTLMWTKPEESVGNSLP